MLGFLRACLGWALNSMPQKYQCLFIFFIVICIVCKNIVCGQALTVKIKRENEPVILTGVAAGRWCESYPMKNITIVNMYFLRSEKSPIQCFKMVWDFFQNGGNITDWVTD